MTQDNSSKPYGLEESDADLNAKLKARGMFTLEEMLDDKVSGLGPFDTHVGVITVSDLGQWIDRKREEYLRMRLRYEVGDKEKDDLYEWVLAHGAAFSCISKHFRKVIDPSSLSSPAESRGH